MLALTYQAIQQMPDRGEDRQRIIRSLASHRDPALEGFALKQDHQLAILGKTPAGRSQLHWHARSV